MVVLTLLTVGCSASITPQNAAWYGMNHAIADGCYKANIFTAQTTADIHNVFNRDYRKWRGNGDYENTRAVSVGYENYKKIIPNELQCAQLYTSYKTALEREASRQNSLDKLNQTLKETKPKTTHCNTIGSQTICTEY